MSKSRRPPDILRKSHAHSPGDTRARDKRELEQAIDEIDVTDADDDGDAESEARKRRRGRDRAGPAQDGTQEG